MKRKTLRRISVTTTIEAEDAVAELLNGILGPSAISYHDIESRLSTVTSYVQQKLRSPHKVREEISAGLRRIKGCGLKIGSGKITIAGVRREDWAESWKRHFKPFEVGAVLLIKPSWSKRKARSNQAVVVLDPGLSFGTGQHPTTAFCLGEIVRWQKGGDSVPRCLDTAARHPRHKLRSFLDLGAGSGILAIAAAKLGYSPVNAMDFDPEAVCVARANARANRVHQKLKITRGNVAKLQIHPKRRHDLVCANLISSLLIAERRRITAQLNRTGRLVLAGILKSEFAAVQKAFEALGLELAASRSKKEWRSGAFQFAHLKNL